MNLKHGKLDHSANTAGFFMHVNVAKILQLLFNWTWTWQIFFVTYVWILQLNLTVYTLTMFVLCCHLVCAWLSKKMKISFLQSKEWIREKHLTTNDSALFRSNFSLCPSSFSSFISSHLSFLLSIFLWSLTFSLQIFLSYVLWNSLKKKFLSFEIYWLTIKD